MTSMSSSTSDWLLKINGLTVDDQRNGCDADPVADGRGLATQLRIAATRYRAVSECATWACGAQCPLNDDAAGSFVCRLAANLTPETGVLHTPEGPIVPAATPVDDLTSATAALLDALSAATPAVFTCRRCAHPTGECWFSDAGPEGDICGQVLSAAHRVDG